METLKIEIVSDVVCTWCVIGFINLKKAMEELKEELTIYKMKTDIKNLFNKLKFDS